jgi:hypothetical protein
VSKTNASCLLNSIFLGSAIVFATFSLYVHNNLLPYIYFIFSVYVIIAHKGYVKVDEELLAVGWLLMALLPIPFLLYYQDVLLAVMNIILFLGLFIARKNYDCGKNKNEWCLLCRHKHSH